MAEGFGLAADDRVLVWRSGGRLFGKAPSVLSGLMEVRGAGVLAAAALPMAEIVLVADLSARPERMPEPPTDTLLDLVLPRIALDPDDASAPLRLRAALAASQHGL